jgi:hypothetical protein
MVRTIAIMSLIAVALGCGAPSRPASHRGPDPVRIRDWKDQDLGQALWPEWAQRVQVIVTRSSDGAFFLAWIISEGSEVLEVYRATPAERPGMYERIFRQNNPSLSAFLQVRTGSLDKVGIDLPAHGAPTWQVPLGRDNLEVFAQVRPPAPAAGAGSGSGSGSGCKDCVYTPWNPPQSGPIMPPNEIRQVTRYTLQIDGLLQGLENTAALGGISARAQ